MKTQLKKFVLGFAYAARGIWTGIKEERNLRFHLCATVFVLAFSAFYPFTRTEYLILCLCITCVIGAELMNSAVERAADKPDGAYSLLIRAAKDMAAGAVLAVSLGAFICGLLLFWDIEIFMQIGLFFINNLWAAVLLILYLAVAAWFVFIFGEKKKE